MVAGQGAWTLPISEEARLAIVPGSIGWDILKVNTKTRGVEIVSKGLDAGYAQGMVEELARTEGKGWMTNRDAYWRKSTELSDKQLNFAATLGIQVSELRTTLGRDVTKGDLSDAIDAKVAEKQLRSWLKNPGRAA